MKKIILLFIACFIGITVSYGQRRNFKGEKMVKNISIEWHNMDGNRVEWRCYNIEFYYDSDGVMIGVDKSYDDEGNHYELTYQLDDEERFINGEAYMNGKKIPDYKLRILPKRYCVTDTPVYSDDGKLIVDHWKQVIEYTYSKDGIEAVLRTFGGGENDISVELQTGIDRFIDKSSTDADITLYERSWGVNRVYRPSYILTNDGKYYCEFKDNEITKDFIFIDNNLQANFSRSDDGTPSSEDVYLDRENDTNIEFYGFSKMGERSRNVFNNIEWCTGWMKTRSKNLIQMENRIYKYGSRKMDEMVRASYPEKYRNVYKSWKDMCEKLWEYTFDGNGNITRIDIHNKEASYGEGYMLITYEY